MKLSLEEVGLVDYMPLAFGLVLAGVGTICVLLDPAYSLAALALVLLGLALYRWTPPEDRRVALWVLGLSLAFRLVLLVALHLVKKGQGYHGFLSGDEGLYFMRALEFSEYLRGHRDVPFSLRHGVNAYTYFSGVVIALTRPSLFLLKVLNLCVGLAATFGFYRWARSEFGRRAGLLVLSLIAFYPSLQYWSITGLKEPHMIFILMVGLWIAYRLCGDGRFWALWAVAAGGVVAILGTYNPYLSAVLAFAVAFGWLLGRHPKQVALASASTLAGGAWLYWTNGPVAAMVREFLVKRVIYYQLGVVKSDLAGYSLYFHDSFRNVFPYHVGPNKIYWFGWVGSWLKGLGYFLFSPFPWAIKSMGQLVAYPQILLWYGLFPFVLYGAWILLKVRRQQVLPLIVYVISLPSILALTSGNIGEAFRHRDWIIPFCLMFAVVGVFHFLREPELLARLRDYS
ncbi:glycosyltransferase family 39 protein [Nitrospinae bacterium AH_259_B05_G02_I21]|nr:glycosyltransferase family 39 protein [Nitrospinae bacterium AH_259_B05_G02_I21]MDA2931907.1 glycosyltransferase family 39 protein [Nitrospinae bacterium AH-259-F20]